jgi:hypothetical protein
MHKLFNNKTQQTGFGYAVFTSGEKRSCFQILYSCGFEPCRYILFFLVELQSAFATDFTAVAAIFARPEFSRK